MWKTIHRDIAMIPRLRHASGFALWVALCAAAPAALAVTVPDPVTQPAAAVPKQLKINVAWQIALEAADFSPGILDGVFKRKSIMALDEYAARYFPGLNRFDSKIYEALKVDVDRAFVLYTVSADDAAQVGGPLSDDWNEKARLKRLDYESLAECLTEKFHCTRALLESVNPGVKLETLEPGQPLLVPNIRPFPTDNRVTVTKRSAGTAAITVNLGEKTIRVFDKDNNQLALFHCSIAKDKAKLPDRDAKIQTIAAPNPNYTFNPDVWPEVHNVTRTLIIPPGPRNPVGLAWCSLDLPGYGIHGTPKPELIGKTGSHGCFRLTNWDALKFAGLVKEGLPVRIINPERDAAAQ
jgi:lipoprotein-anchoring transpeptidase ErfK/SrfK